MTGCLILCRSLTNAQRFTRCLDMCGISSHAVRVPGKLSGNGCGYAVRVSRQDVHLALSHLKSCGYKPGRVYNRLEDDSYAEWEL